MLRDYFILQHPGDSYWWHFSSSCEGVNSSSFAKYQNSSAGSKGTFHLLKYFVECACLHRSANWGEVNQLAQGHGVSVTELAIMESSHPGCWLCALITGWRSQIIVGNLNIGLRKCTLRPSKHFGEKKTFMVCFGFHAECGCSLKWLLSLAEEGILMKTLWFIR